MDERVSAVLIVKNEQELLPRCLKTLAGVDEIVVLDTGSSDKTVDVARANGARVEIAQPITPFHFAQARNQATALASNDWILSMDADEILRPGSIRKIRNAIDTHKDATAFLSTFINRPEADVKSFMTFGAEPRQTDIRDFPIQKIKLFRKSAYEWQYRVHEQLKARNAKEIVLDLSSVVIEHMPTFDKTKRHSQNIDLLKLCVQENPEYAGAWKHLGLELRLRKEWNEAISCLAAYLERSQEDSIEKSQAMMAVGTCYAETNRMTEAFQWFEMSWSTDERRREPLYLSAWYSMKTAKNLDDVIRAASYLEKLVSINPNKRPGSVHDSPAVWGREPHRMLEVCREDIGRLRKAGING